MNTLPFDGVNASLALPMTSDAAPDLTAMRRYARWIADQGVVAVTINADTGEGAHLSVDERLAVTEAVKDEVGDDVTVVSGLIAGYTDQAVDIARALTAAGADALLVFSIPAFQGDPLPADMVTDYFRAIADVDAPLIAFNLTRSLGGVVFAPETLRRIVAIPQVVAVKEASFDAVNYVASRDAVRRDDHSVAFLSGCDNFIYESFVLGADGALLGYSGLAPALTDHVFRLVGNHEFEQAAKVNREQLQPLAEALFAPPARNSRARIKHGLARLGLIDATTVRAPLQALPPDDAARVERAMVRARLL